MLVVRMELFGKHLANVSTCRRSDQRRDCRESGGSRLARKRCGGFILWSAYVDRVDVSHQYENVVAPELQ
jgi:hypothetical protein